MIKDGCNNMEKNAILRFHDAGKEVPDIARALRLTERIVENMIEYYRPDSDLIPDPKPEKPKKKKAKKKDIPEAADEFDED